MKLKKKISILFVVLVLVLSLTSTTVAVADDSCQHKYVFGSIKSGTVTYECSNCGVATTKSIADVFEMWSDDVYNTVDDNSYLDFVPDGFINAKDYVKIRDEYRKFIMDPSLDIGEEL